jgi:hypothetical protein
LDANHLFLVAAQLGETLIFQKWTLNEWMPKKWWCDSWINKIIKNLEKMVVFSCFVDFFMGFFIGSTVINPRSGPIGPRPTPGSWALLGRGCQTAAAPCCQTHVQI